MTPSQQPPGNQVDPGSLRKGHIAYVEMMSGERAVVLIDYIRDDGTIRGWRGSGTTITAAARNALNQFWRWSVAPAMPDLKSKATRIRINQIKTAYVVDDILGNYPSGVIAPGLAPPMRLPVMSTNPVLREAISESRYARFSYMKATEPGAGTVTDRLVECIYVFISSEGKEVLLGIDRSKGQFRFFRVENISNATIDRVFKVDYRKRRKLLSRKLVNMKREGRDKDPMYKILLLYLSILSKVIKKRKGKEKEHG